MRIRWRGLELPSQVLKDEAVSTRTYGRFVIEPFERGFGTTVGNSLRRILLSSLEGAAVVRVKIRGADHEFTSLPGVFEDVTDVILNIKKIVVRLEGDEPKTMRVERRTKGPVTAGDIQADPAIEVVNKDHVLATLTDDVEFAAEMTVARGRGYVPAEENISLDMEIGLIAVDSMFSPVTRVRYRTEETRVGQRTNYDRLIMEIWTKGTVSPEMALVEAAKILRKHLNPFVQYFDLGIMAVPVEVEAPPEVPAEVAADTRPVDVDEELQQKLNMSIAELDLSVRASNCLESAHINTVGDLVRMSEADLLKVRSFGKTSLREVKRKLADIGLALGLNLPAGAGTAGQEPESDASMAESDGM
jgi:DNA-directed RNA polymerase subunit alpha